MAVKKEVWASPKTHHTANHDPIIQRETAGKQQKSVGEEQCLSKKKKSLDLRDQVDTEAHAALLHRGHTDPCALS